MGWPSRLLQWLVLAPLSALYALVAAVRRALRSRASVAGRTPVVVIGNLTAGGTGKTPLVIWLVKSLQARGLRVGVVSRGYGRSNPDALLEVTAQSSPEDCGDEPLLIARATSAPVVVCSNRLAACAMLEARGVQLIVADDGLQHYRMPRGLEIAVVDGRRGLGNGWLLPAGPLRESSSRLRSVDAVVYNDAAEAVATSAGGANAASVQTASARPAGAMSMRLRPAQARNLASGEIRSLRSFAADGQVHAVAGIGNPERFFATLRAAGLDIVPQGFPDHHAYGAAELDFGDRKPVLMTAKDAVKCQPFADQRLWEVPVDAELAAADSERLLAMVMNILPRGT